MRASGFVAAVLSLFAVPAWPQEPARQAPPIAGVWKLNPEKSSMQVPPDYMEIRQYYMRPDGFLVGLLINGNPSRGYHYLQFVAKRDGNDYPEYSDPIVGDMIAAGKPTLRTYSETPIDEYVTDWTDKVDGKVTAHGKKTVSKDLKTLTITVNGSPAVRIYDRQ
jgi:hypothetical protein